MTTLNDFYKSLLNINNIDHTKEISDIVKSELVLLKRETDDLTGFCKYLAHAIYDRLKETNISSNIIDLNELVGVDHVILITNTKPRILIDPTFIQFNKTSDKKLVGLSKWPSEKIDKELLKKLLDEGYIEVSNTIFNNYINSFTDIPLNIDLENYILEMKLNHKNGRL